MKPRSGRIAGTAIAGILAATLATCSVNTVPAGHVGVRHVFGNVKETEFKSGFRLKNPLESVVDMSVRTKETKEAMKVPTSKGLLAGLEVSALYHLNPETANEVYGGIGPDGMYEATLIQPNMRSVVRDVVANYLPEDLYSGVRESISSDIHDGLEPILSSRGVVLEQVLIRDLSLPEKLTSAIEAKMEADQNAQAMEYVLQKESQEAERKRIEAKGIADAQAIISKSLDQPYLQWKYIEGLKGLVESDTNTVVVMPYDQKLTPLLQVPNK